MNDSVIDRVEQKIDDHIVKHDEDYKKLLWWLIGILVALLGSFATGFITIGADQNRILQLEKQQEASVSRVEFNGSIELMNNKLKNIDDKLIDIKQGLNLK